MKIRTLDTSRKLETLADRANSEHHRATSAWRHGLEHARKAGEALLEAKELLTSKVRRARRKYGGGGRRKWGEWLKRNFHASPETARVYMRVAKHWNHPSIQHAWIHGFGINSIQGFLDVLASRKCPEATQDKQMDLMRWEIRRMFAEQLRKLSKTELEVFADDKTFEMLWKKLHSHLKSFILLVLDLDLYDESDYDRATERIAIRKIRRACGWDVPKTRCRKNRKRHSAA